MENDSKIEVVNLTLTFLLYALEWPVLYQEPKLFHFLNIQSANQRIGVRYNIYIRSQNTVESDSTDECESEYILPRTKISARSCKLEGNTEAFQASEVYQDPDNHPQIFQKFCQLAHIFLKEQKAHEPCQDLFRDRLSNPSDIFQQFVEPKSKLYPGNLLHLG